MSTTSTPTKLDALTQLALSVGVPNDLTAKKSCLRSTIRLAFRLLNSSLGSESSPTVSSNSTSIRRRLLGGQNDTTSAKETYWKCDSLISKLGPGHSKTVELLGILAGKKFSRSRTSNSNANTNAVLGVAFDDDSKTTAGRMTQERPTLQLDPPPSPPTPPPQAPPHLPQHPLHKQTSQHNNNHISFGPNSPFTEAHVLRECIFALQGISGKIVDFSSNANHLAQGCVSVVSLVSSPSVSSFPPGVKSLIRSCAEVGWLFLQVKSYLDSRSSAEEVSTGIVSQAFTHAVEDELSEYYKMISVLSKEVEDVVESGNSDVDINNNNNNNNNNNQDPTHNPLTLRTLHIWLLTPSRTLQTLSTLTTSCSPLSGGQLLTTLHAHANHGDPHHRTIVTEILDKASKPFYKTLYRFVVHGELGETTSAATTGESAPPPTATTSSSSSSPSSEFFVTSDRSVSRDHLWSSKYTLNPSQMTPLISPSLARSVLEVGRGINFVRKCCGEGGFAISLAEEGGLEEGVFGFGVAGAGGGGKGNNNSRGEGRLKETVMRALGEVNEKIRQLLMEKFNLMDHLLAIKKIMLLGQGDFVTALLDLVGPELSKRASQIYRHNLLGVLDSALRISNAAHLPPHVLSRIGVRLFEASPGDSGWDVFSLDYAVASPLTAIVTPKSATSYRRIFHLLWRLKRIEWGLNSTWRRGNAVEKALRSQHSNYKNSANVSVSNASNIFNSTLNSAMRKVALARQEMLHVMSNIQSYLMFEVLESSWRMLQEGIENAKNLDEIIVAHDAYLDNIINKGLMGDDEGSRSLAGQMNLVFDIADRFCAVQNRLFIDCLSEIDGQGRRMAMAQRNILEGKWGDDSDLGGNHHPDFNDSMNNMSGINGRMEDNEEASSIGENSFASSTSTNGLPGAQTFEQFSNKSSSGVRKSAQDFEAALNELLAMLGDKLEGIGGGGINSPMVTTPQNTHMNNKSYAAQSSGGGGATPGALRAIQYQIDSLRFLTFRLDFNEYYLKRKLRLAKEEKDILP